MSFAIPALALGGALIARRLLRPVMDLRGKVVLITGGARGLGFALAREFARKGASLVICSRTEDQLSQATQALRAEGAHVLMIPCDVSDREQVRDMMRQSINAMGRIDVLVNNAGVIQVGPARQMQAEDFEQAFNVNFWGTLYPILEVLPYMTEAGAGSIVNITSIGGKISVPHLIPYSCAKFAAVALSEGLRAELGPDGIHVLTVAPTLMRTGSFINAFFKGEAQQEYTWFTASANLPGIAMAPDRAARRIVSALQNRRSEIVLSLPAKAAVRAHALFPQFTQQLMGLVSRMLPDPTASNGEAQRGAKFAAQGDTAMVRVVNQSGKKAVDRYQWNNTPVRGVL